MDDPKNTIINELEKERQTSEIYRKFIDLMLAKNDDIVASLEKLSANAEENSKELQRRLKDSGTFRDILFRALAAFMVVQFLAAVLFAWVLLTALK